MANDFSAPTTLTDVVLIVEEKRLYVSRNYLAHHSQVLHKMLLGEFVESQQHEVTLTAPENLKYDEFVALLKVIYPPHEEVTADTYGFLVELADFYQVKDVVQKCDKFLANDLMIPMIEKLYLVDKYKLTETKNACLNSVELKKTEFVRDLTKKPEYKEISTEFKVALLENGLNSAEDMISSLKIEKLNLEYGKDSAEHEVASLEYKLNKAKNYYCINCVHQLYSQGVKRPAGMHCHCCNKYFSK